MLDKDENRRRPKGRVLKADGPYCSTGRFVHQRGFLADDA